MALKTSKLSEKRTRAAFIGGRWVGIGGVTTINVGSSVIHAPAATAKDLEALGEIKGHVYDDARVVKAKGKSKGKAKED